MVKEALITPEVEVVALEEDMEEDSEEDMEGAGLQNSPYGNWGKGDYGGGK